MNAKKLIVAVAVLSATGSVLANNDLPYPEYRKFESTRSRAEVIAEIKPSAPTLSTANNEVVEFKNTGSTLTRAEVNAELAKDFADGINADLRNPEFVEHTQFASSKTRDQVRDEAIQAAKSKNLVNKASGS